MIVTGPPDKPFSLGCTVGCVCPAVNTTLGIVKLAFAGSLTVSVTTVPAAAGLASLMLKFACSAGATVTLGGRMMSCQFKVTLAVVSANSGNALALITDVPPGVTGVTEKLAVVAPGANVTVAGTVTTPGLIDVRFTVNPVTGAGPDRVKVSVPGARSSNVRLAGVNSSVPVVRAVWEPAV